ncbi:MAG: PilZ domain-containing protein [Nitrospira sp.]|nr:PilZ domain-containing protein [Nitrospira sp.]
MTTLNLSGSGIGFVITQRVGPGDTLQLTIVLPSGPPIQTTAQVVYLVPIERSIAKRVGARFTDLSKEDQDRIVNHLFTMQQERRRSRYDI